MKLKEINRTAIQAWSPAQHHPVYLATGTSAQQLDATFSTSASLEIFELDLAEHSLDMKSSGTFSSPHRYHKLVWGPHESDSEDFPMGVLIAGGENGNIILYDPSKIVSGSSEVVIDQSSKHTGPVRALDVNSFQTNLVASGANESEIYIWDLNSFNSPMTPGPKSQPLEDISCVAWNRQVQHILASASPSGRASVWDLRKNDLIIKVSDHSNRMHCSGLAWNPDVATQLVLASEDDRMPVIQMWDLRFATSPLKVLENHTRGVLAIAWSLADPELLLSCGKDNRILCWNPNTAEVLYELPTSTQWCFDIQWCPRNPAVLSAASFDGHISVYSIMGGSNDAVSSRQADQISTSFGNLDPFGTGQTLPPLQLPHSTAAKTSVTPLKKPPKWIRRPVGASFAFGGKLVSLDNSQPSQQQQQHVVRISQVVTETTFLERSNQLQATLSSGSFVEFCQTKISAAPNEFERTVWSFLKVNFESDSRGKYLELLGYKKEELAQKAAKIEEPEEMEEPEEHGEELDIFPTLLHLNVKVTLVNLLVDVDGLITQALLTGDFESAVDLCLHDDRMADSIILAIAGGPELLEKTQKKYFSKSQSKISKLISAVVMKDWRNILETCDLHSWRESLAAVMTYAKPDEFSSLCGLLGSRLDRAEDQALQTQACLCYICAGSLEKLVTSWAKEQDSHCPLSLQDLVEKVVILQQAVEKSKGSAASIVGPLLAQKMSQYASLLASQGSLDTALSYFGCGQYWTPGISVWVSDYSSCWFTEYSSFVPCCLQVQGNFAPPAPITAPIMGEPPAQMNPCMQALQPGSQALYNPNHQQTMAPSQPLNPTTPMINVEGAPGAPIGDVIQPLQSIPTEKITKKPIPEEHLILKTTFEGLIQKCLAAAADPQTKRKLDDATKRLEFLYDKLRDQSLSPAIVGGLHNIAQSIESRAYTDGLGIHTHIVSSSNFSETSAFMPVLKVVLTQANKLGV
uniref:Protein transport protein Sec31A n=1 Tax=Denticeps clupeoides TaxID=299321 RepID=A0AAY4B0L7_9TELE